MANAHEPFIATVIEIRTIAEDTKKFRFRITKNAPDCFLPGQFFLLQADEKINRAYSIASSPSQLPEFDLLIKLVPNGAATTKLWEMNEGEEVHFRGPMGRFGLRNPKKKQIFIATGTGLAPMRSFWQSLLELENPPEMELIFGVRCEKNIFCLQEFSDCASQMKSSMCLSRPEEKSDLIFEGRVTDCVRNMEASRFENAEVYLCGSKEMVDEMKVILTEKGVGGERIGVESW